MANISRYDPFDDFFRGFFVRPVEFGSAPEAPQVKIDVKEQADAYVVHAELPGVKKEDIHLHIGGAMVSLTAERNVENEVRGRRTRAAQRALLRQGLPQFPARTGDRRRESGREAHRRRPGDHAAEEGGGQRPAAGHRVSRRPSRLFNLPAAFGRYAEIARMMGLEGTGSDEKIARLGQQRMVEICEECRLPSRMSELGVPEQAVPRMAKAAMTVTRLLKNNPREVTEQDAERIYRAAL